MNCRSIWILKSGPRQQRRQCRRCQAICNLRFDSYLLPEIEKCYLHQHTLKWPAKFPGGEKKLAAAESGGTFRELAKELFLPISCCFGNRLQIRPRLVPLTSGKVLRPGPRGGQARAGRSGGAAGRIRGW